jgi:hypothetical protein
MPYHGGMLIDIDVIVRLFPEMYPFLDEIPMSVLVLVIDFVLIGLGLCCCVAAGDYPWVLPFAVIFLIFGYWFVFSTAHYVFFVVGI